MEIKTTTTIRYFQKRSRISYLTNNHTFFDSIIILRFGETKKVKEKFYCAKIPRNIWDVNVDNIVISKLVKTKTNSKYLNGYLDKVIRTLVFILSKMSGYVKTFKDKAGDKDKNYKLVSFLLDVEKIEDLKNIELNASPVYNDRYRKTKTRTYDDKVYNKFRSLNVPQEDDIERESFTVIFIDSLVVQQSKYYLQVYLDNCAYEIIDK